MTCTVIPIPKYRPASAGNLPIPARGGVKKRYNSTILLFCSTFRLSSPPCMMLHPQACFLASNNHTISKKRGVIGSHHGESLCSLLVEVKIIMSTLNNNGINLSITTPCHCIGAVGVGVADVQPPPVQHCQVILVVVAAAATRPPPC